MHSLQFNLDKHQIDNLINSVLDELQIQATVKNIHLIPETNNLHDQLVMCDFDMIKTVIRNLISNSIKFTDNDKNIFVSVNHFSDDENYIVVGIRDEGVGMSHETMSKLFRIDEKVSTKGTNNEAGTGLGLILCKEFIDKHKCKI